MRISEYTTATAIVDDLTLFDLSQWDGISAYDTRKMDFGTLKGQITLINGEGNTSGTLDGTGRHRVASLFPNSYGVNSISPDQDDSFFANELRYNTTLTGTVQSDIGSTFNMVVGSTDADANNFYQINSGIGKAQVYGSDGAISVTQNSTIANGSGFFAGLSGNQGLVADAIGFAFRKSAAPTDSFFPIITVNNSVVPITIQDFTDAYPTSISGRNITSPIGSVNTGSGGGDGITMKTNNSWYSNKFIVNQDGSSFEAVIDTETRTTDGTYTLPDGSGGSIGMIKTGTYTGDGTTSQAISSVGFTPKYVRIWPQETVDGSPANVYVTTDTIVDDSGSGMAIWHNDDGGGGVKHESATDAIISLDFDGFTVDDAGVDSDPNASGVTYNYLAQG